MHFFNVKFLNGNWSVFYGTKYISMCGFVFLTFWCLFHFLPLFLKEEMPLESQWQRLVRRRLTAMASVCHSLLSVPSMCVTQHGAAWVWWRVGVVLFCFGVCLVLLSAFPMCAVTVVYLSTFSGDNVSSRICIFLHTPTGGKSGMGRRK